MARLDRPPNPADGAQGLLPASTTADRELYPHGGSTSSPPLRLAVGDLHRLLVESIRDYAIFALAPDGHVLTWNAGAERLKGYTADEIIGQHFSVFYPPEPVAAGFPAYELEVAARTGQFEDEGWRVRRDGSRFWANVVITALRDGCDTLVGYAKVTRDLTTRRQAEEALRESEERFRLLVNGVRDYAIFMLDPAGRVSSWNEGARRIKGYEPADIIGRHFSAFYPEEDVVAGKPPRELEIAARAGTYEEEGWRLRKDGTPFWASVLITALRAHGGVLVGYAKVTRDLTERRAAQERALADARRAAAAEAASRAKSQFLAAMSHELRTPINAALGYAELLELGIGGPVTELQRQQIRRIQASQRHLLQIISDLLNYSRIEAGRVEYTLDQVAVDDLVGSVLPMVEPQAAAKGLVLTCDTGSGGLAVHADRTRVQQVVLNVLSNAVKFTPWGGRVTVTCDAADGQVAIAVADTGPGIPTEQQGAIFEPFVQLGRSLTSGHEGTGLGLAISRDLARAMGGDLTVESAVGVGSTFTLTLARGDTPGIPSPA